MIKETCFDETGKEINASKTCEILHQSGKIYQKQSPDKLPLIKSIGLFDAAFVRNTLKRSETEIDLSETCRYILEKVKAKIQNADLIKKADQAKILFQKWRKETKEFLNNS